MVVYKITNTLNGKSYIGQTIRSATSRFNSHCSFTSGGPQVVKSAIKKYGRENFTLSILSVCSSRQELDDAECYWIDHLQTLTPNGYNRDSGGVKGTSKSEATREAISQANKGHPGWNKGKNLSEEHRLALSIAHKGIPNNWSGRKHSDAAKAKMSAARLGIQKPNKGSFKKGRPASENSFKLGCEAPNKGRKRVIINGVVRYIRPDALKDLKIEKGGI